ncbi:hypothetical protein GCM10009760_09270 [Kitasatospora kazusensis]|uniref:Uncharacterized protein n=1 Tax=Kitasatospora kazusensis TaxID=407974 RepID=A0ABP5KJ97_9ACTN
MRGGETWLTLFRLLLSPWTSWHAHQLMRRSSTPLTFDTAWRRARLRLHPDEAPYRSYGHGADLYAPDDGPS